MENHGTKPGTVDAHGEAFLKKMKELTITGTKKDLLALVNAYHECECAPGTDFISVDAMKSTVVQDIIVQAANYATDHLDCINPTDVSDIAHSMQTGQIDEALVLLAGCTWKDGASWDDGLNQAVMRIAKDTGQTLNNYHVCNNDAALQANLIAKFQQTGVVSACDRASETCKGPKWFYSP